MSNEVFLTIVVLGLVTAFNRFVGYWIMQFVPLSGRVKAGLEALPPAILISLVAPMMLKAGPAGFISVGVAVAAVLLLKDSALAVLCGIAAVIVARYTGLV